MRRRPGTPSNTRLRGHVTPMIDVVFLLLIVFLLMPSDEGRAYLTTGLPDLGVGEGAPPDYMPVEIELRVPEANKEGVAIVLNHRRALGRDFRGLLAALEDLRARGLPAEHPVLIRPQWACRHKWVVRAFDVAVGARFANIQFAVPDR